MLQKILSGNKPERQNLAIYSLSQRIFVRHCYENAENSSDTSYGDYFA